ncbi:MAG: hypothetical protein ACWA5A_05575, partial [Marinibacterium sp.]
RDDETEIAENVATTLEPSIREAEMSPMDAEPRRPTEVSRLRDKRYVTKDLTLKYDRKRIRSALPTRQSRRTNT